MMYLQLFPWSQDVCSCKNEYYLLMLITVALPAYVETKPASEPAKKEKSLNNWNPFVYFNHENGSVYLGIIIKS